MIIKIWARFYDAQNLHVHARQSVSLGRNILLFGTNYELVCGRYNEFSAHAIFLTVGTFAKSHRRPSVYSIWQTKSNVSGRRQQDILADFCLWCRWHFPSGQWLGISTARSQRRIFERTTSPRHSLYMRGCMPLLDTQRIPERTASVETYILK